MGDLEFFGLTGDFDLSIVDLKVRAAFGEEAFLLLTETGDPLLA